MKVIVIGAGVMGLACAWRLAQAGAAVVLLESRSCGEGATLAALGALWPANALVNGPLQSLHRESLWGFESFAEELAAFAGMPVTFRRGGRVEFLNSSRAVDHAREEAAAACASWPAFGGSLPVMEVMDAARIAALFPESGIAQSALFCRATAQVNVRELVVALRAACLKAGVDLQEQRTAQELIEEHGRIKGVHTGGEMVAVDTVLVSAGAWSNKLSPLLKAAAPLRPVKGQGLALQRPDGVTFHSILKLGAIYLIPWDGEILVGSTTEPEAGFDERPTDEARAELLAGAAALVPALRGARVLRHWAGLRPQHVAKGHWPIMGPHPTMPNLFICSGHFKTGIGMSPEASRLMAKAILEGETPAALARFRPK